MSTDDLEIAQQSYQLFLDEAPELIGKVEAGVLNLSQETSTADLHDLMRATHTLKGAAANIRQNTIKTVSHQLEDVFRALMSPDAVIDREVNQWVLEVSDCLRLAWNAETQGDRSSDESLLARVDELYKKLQAKLGDCFDYDPLQLSSSDLGFDMTRSVFEVGMKQRLEQLAALLETSSDRAEIDSYLRSQLSVISGLAESLSLPGLEEITRLGTAALDRAPESAVEIARAVLADLQQAREDVLAGDRARGGNPSPELLQLAGENAIAWDDPFGGMAIDADLAQAFPEVPSLAEAFGNFDPSALEVPEIVESGLASFESDLLQPVESESLPAPKTFESVTEERSQPPSRETSAQPASISASDRRKSAPIGKAIAPPELPDRAIEGSEPRRSGHPSEFEGSSPATLPGHLNRELLSDTTSPDFPTSQLEREAPSKRHRAPVRVELEQLEHLSHIVSELSIEQNQLLLRNDQYRTATTKLQTWLQQHRHTLNRWYGEWRQRLGNKAADLQSYYAALEETAQLEQAIEDLNLLARATGSVIEQEQRLFDRLRDSLETVRMLPVEKVFNRFPPMVEQLSAVYDKDVELQVYGTQVLIDKAIAEGLYDALLHLVRNAFDHGIESVETRRQRGKPDTGRIELHAYNQGNRTVIEVSDDGRGLNVEAICQQARNRGQLSAAQVEQIRRSPNPADRVLRVLCQPGFSTVAKANDLSGRGVGLDVVYTQMQAINGSLRVDSEPDRGTTFSLSIRGALMNARLLVVRAGEQIYAFVSDEVVQVAMLSPEWCKYLGEQKVMHWQSKDSAGTREAEDNIAVPIYELGALFTYRSRLDRGRPQETLTSLGTGLPSSLLDGDRETVPVLILQRRGGYIGLEIDAIIEEEELVVKPISDIVTPPPYLYGCTSLADGRLTLVIDGVALVDCARQTSGVGRSPRPAARTERVLAPSDRVRAAGETLNTDATNPYGYFSAAAGNLATAEHSLPAGTSQNSETTTQSSLRTLLVVDDSITERQTLTSILQKAGHYVVQASDGQEALEKLQQGLDVDLAICDLEMPRLNGLELLGMMSQDPSLSEIPAIVLTSRTREKYQHLAMELGARAYLTKPYLDRELLDAIGTTLRD